MPLHCWNSTSSTSKSEASWAYQLLRIYALPLSKTKPLEREFSLYRPRSYVNRSVRVHQKFVSAAWSGRARRRRSDALTSRPSWPRFPFSTWPRSRFSRRFTYSLSIPCDLTKAKLSVMILCQQSTDIANFDLSVSQSHAALLQAYESNASFSKTLRILRRSMVSCLHLKHRCSRTTRILNVSNDQRTLNSED